MQHPIDIFLHIPKTRGTTIENAMARNYPPNSIRFVRCRIRNVSTSEAVVCETPLPELRASIEAMQSHIVDVKAVVSLLPYGVHNLISLPCRYFTMLRDPIGRCLSAWFFILSRGPSHPIYQIIERHDFDFESVLASKSAFIFHNDQTRYITGDKAFSLNEDDVAAAFDRLRNDFTAVGIMERFRESFNEIANSLTWSNRSFGHANKTPHKAPGAITPAALDALHTQNACDCQLYRLVTKWLGHEL